MQVQVSDILLILVVRNGIGCRRDGALVDTHGVRERT